MTSRSSNGSFLRILQRVDALHTVRVEGDKLTVPDSDSLKPEEMPVALWVNWTGDELPAKPIQKYTYQQGGFVFKMEGVETNMWLYDENAQAHMYRAIPLPVPGEWTHLAVTFGNDVQRGYVNGIAARSGGGVEMPWVGPIGHVVTLAFYNS